MMKPKAQLRMNVVHHPPLYRLVYRLLEFKDELEIEDELICGFI